MAGNAGLLYFWTRLEKDSSLDLNLFKRQKKSSYNSSELEGSSDQTKSYADNRRRPLEFEERNHVYLNVSPLRGMRRFKVKGKLSPRYIGPF
jgi:hypothetical protein